MNNPVNLDKSSYLQHVPDKKPSASETKTTIISRIFQTRMLFAGLLSSAVIITAVLLAIPGVNGIIGVTLFTTAVIATGIYVIVNRERLLYECSLARQLLKKNYPWYSEIDQGVYLGAIPLQKHRQNLQDLNIQLVISVVKPFENHTNTLFSTPIRPEYYKNKNIKHFQYDCQDFRIVDTNTLVKAVEEIQKAVKEGKRIVVHCKAGRGRSALLIACWLKTLYPEKTPQDIIDLVKEKRPVIALKKKHISPIETFAKRWNELNKRP